MAFTAGPWHTAGIANPTTNPRMSIWGPTPAGAQSGEWIAKDVTPENARLIAAAPDLLAALKGVLVGFAANDFCRNTDGDSDPAWMIHFLTHLLAISAAAAAIEKAEG